MKTGLLVKHPEDSPLMVGFRKFLEASYSTSFINHQVPCVARYLYFMDPREVSVKCIYNIRKTVEFFVQLNALNTSKPTARNYLESIKSFVKYVASEEQFLEEDPALPHAVEKFFTAAKYILIGIRRRKVPTQPGKENHACTPEGCQRLLTTVKPYFLSLIIRVKSMGDLEDRDYNALCNYLVALLILQHLQSPTVVRDMTVHQWLLRSHLTVQVGEEAIEVAVIRVEQRTAEMRQIAIIALEKQEEMWFDTFFRKVRPVFMKNVNKGEDHFFVATNGGKIKNLTYNHKKFHERFHLPEVKVQQVRKVFEQCCLSRCNDEEQQLLRKHLRLSPQAAKPSETDLVRAAVLW
ncbi:unnamed protein product [Staurois parvus]|uniref:Core-binding (CB) domain-containing protein n=1 Tax=Staurois parvus TaxID=386267 RepID=A0ABN9E785_9NEOB|nr:unnamed protein product [Staurois parvus]